MVYLLPNWENVLREAHGPGHRRGLRGRIEDIKRLIDTGGALVLSQPELFQEFRAERERQAGQAVREYLNVNG